MKIALGYIVRNEQDMLERTLPTVVYSFQGVVAVDALSTDKTVEVLKSYGATVVSRQWTGHYGDARNACIREAERLGFDWLLMLDADECFVSRDLANLTLAVESMPPCTAIALPRFEFVDDLFHFNPVFYPDFQSRCFPLRVGFRYEGRLHEQLYFGSEPAYPTGRAIAVPYIHIFHYGKCGDPKRMWLKYVNYDRLALGKPLLESIPENVEPLKSYSQGPRLMFHGERPI